MLAHALLFRDISRVEGDGCDWGGAFGVVHKAIWRGTVVAAKLIHLPSGSEADVNQEIEMCRYV